MTIILIAAAAVTLLIAYTLWGIRQITTPIKGPRIDRADRPNAALMIIDMQTVFTRMDGTDAWSQDRLSHAMARIRALADQARADQARTEGRKVIVVRQVYQGWYTNLMIRLTAKGRGATGSDGLELDPALDLRPDLDIEKPLGDSFSAVGLDAYLATHRIGAIEIAGLDGNYCVKTTARGALGRGYHVTLIDDAILAQDQTAWSAEKAALTEIGAAVR